MANSVTKQILQWEVKGEAEAVASLTRTASMQRTLIKNTQELNANLTDLRVNDAAVKLGQDYGKLATDIDFADDSAKALAADLTKIGATKSDIAAASAEFEKFRKAQEESGGGLTGLQQVGKLGSKLRALPSVQLGGGVSSDAIANILRLVGGLPPVVLAVAGAVAALGAAIVIVNKNVPDVTAGIRQITELDKEYYKARIAGTKDSIRAIVEEKQLEQKIAQARLDDLQHVSKGYDELHNKLGVLSAPIDAVIEAAGALGAGNFKDIRDARIAYDEANTELNKANKELGLYNGLLGDQTVALNTADVALKKFAVDVAEQTIGSIEEHAKVQQELNDLIKNGTQKELDNKLEVLRATQKNAETQLADLKKNIDLAEKGSDAQKKYQDAFNKQLDTYNNAGFELSQLGSVAVEAAVKFNDAAEALKKQQQDMVDVVKKLNADVTKETEADLQKRADIEQKYQDAMIKAANTLADAGEKALQTLIDKRSDLLTSFNRGEQSAAAKEQQKSIEDQIKYAEASAKAERDHQRELLKIQQAAQAEQEDAIASRDFAALFRSRRNVSLAIQNSNAQFQSDQAERALQFKEKQDADARQFAFEEAQRLQAYQYANDDAQKQYDRQIKQANIAYGKSLAAAALAANQEIQLQDEKHRTQIAMLQNAAGVELQITQQTAAVKKSIFDNELLQAQQILASMGSGGVVGGSGSGVGLGFGAGLSGGLGSLTTNRSLSNTFNIRGSNAQDIATLVDRRINQTLSGFIN